MLTRLKVSGFKNLVDVDVCFGPFTCVAGANGVGKSNLFDAIMFLGALADRPLADAALSVRAEGERTSDLRQIFHRVGDEYANQVSFEAEMIVPPSGRDDLGQDAKATITFLRYSVTIAFQKDDHPASRGELELIKEELTHINLHEAKEHLLFDHQAAWRKSAVSGRRGSPFISTEQDGSRKIIKLHQDGGPGRALSLLANQLPRTVLSTANAAENPTALLVRREMQSWRHLMLEPSSLRRPDEFNAPTKLGADGSHLAATLYHLARSVDLQSPDHNSGFESKTKHREDLLSRADSASDGRMVREQIYPQSNYSVRPPEGPTSKKSNFGREGLVYGQVANRLSELIDDVSEVSIDSDEKRELLTLRVTGQDGTMHPARALSDGTLRFLALAVLEMDPEAQGLLCLEEPENGIHPLRIPAMLRLLQDIAVDVELPIGPDNPLRQVIINTHSPAVVGQVLDESLLVAELRESVCAGKRFKNVCFSSLPQTWRDRAKGRSVSRGRLMAYLNPIADQALDLNSDTGEASLLPSKRSSPKSRRVIDRPDLQLCIPYQD